MPREKLPECDAVRIPADDLEWQNVPAEYLHAIQALDRCNDVILAFWVWHTSQLPKINFEPAAAQ